MDEKIKNDRAIFPKRSQIIRPIQEAFKDKLTEIENDLLNFSAGVRRVGKIEERSAWIIFDL
ncbi:MAG: hypothetical protein CL920_33960 [Deltaproteobacteria bacterium]|nr:hypothetical protein [Deltaproteobacteria bacterium]MBU53728.1 hypothetical protein [Deltaproteobacteria bacterium]